MRRPRERRNSPWSPSTISRSSSVPLLHDDARRTEKLTVERVATLVYARHHVVVLGRQRGLRRDGFLHRRIEGLIHRLDHLEAGAGQRLPQLLLDEIDAL